MIVLCMCIIAITMVTNSVNGKSNHLLLIFSKFAMCMSYPILCGYHAICRIVSNCKA